MNKTIRNILGLVAGVILGGLINMGIVMISGWVIPPPEGVDVTSMQALEESMHLFQPRHFIMPFMAHALGTLMGAILTAYLCVSEKLKWTLTVGAFFLLGGVANAVALPAPIWFNVLDVGLAYLPMAYLGWKLVAKD